MREFGYDVSDYRKVDPIFGSNADFNALVEAAHGRGLKVIIDLVLAHTSDQHAILCIFNFSNHEAIQELEAEWQPIAEAGFRSSLDSGRVYLHPFGVWFGAARLSHG